MAFFKRIEVWLLLLLSVAGVAWVLWSEREAASEPAPPAPEAGTPGPASIRFAIEDRRVAREGEHLVLTLRVKRSVADAAAPPRILDGDAVRLVTAEGEAVERFFLPFDPETTLDSHSGAETVLRYWLPMARAAGPLWLEIDGDRLAVKSAQPGPELGAWPEGVEFAVAGIDWER